MRIDYDVITKERQLLKEAIGREFNVEVKYHGCPTFAYKFKYGGNMYTIDRFGLLYGADNREIVARMRANHGYVAVSEKYDAPPPETAVADNARRDRLIIEMPLDGFTNTAISNLYSLVKSKEALIKKALRVDDLTIEQTETALQFPWFSADIDTDKREVCTEFIAALCRTAKNQSRATAINKPVQSEKYAFRNFLLKLGFIGSEHKELRKKLLANLSGDAAYKDKPHRRRPTTAPY